MSVKVTSNIDPDKEKKLERAIGLAVLSIGVHMEREASLLAPRDTGRLKGSITYATMDHRSAVRGRARAGDAVGFPFRKNVVFIGTNVEYAAITEYGGTIVAKGKKLAVPVHRSAKRKSPRDFDDLFLIKRVGRAPLLARNAGGPKSKRIDIMYVLMSSVRHPAQPFLRPAFDENRAEVKAILAKVINKEMRSGER